MKGLKLQFESQSLVGRENEIRKLRTVLAISDSPENEKDTIRSRGEPDLVLVHGYSGSGKSAVITQALKTRFDGEEEEESILIHNQCFLIGNGKYDQYEGSGMPFVGLVDSIQDICTKLLREYQEETEEIQSNLQQQLYGFQLKHLVDVVPLVSSILNPTKLGEESPHDAIWDDSNLSTDQFSLKQLKSSLRVFFRVMLRTITNPVVLVIEDLQWADADSLELVEALVTDTHLVGLVVVGSYRDNEVNEYHPLHKFLHSIELQKASERFTRISIPNLDVDNLNEFISSLLQRHRLEDVMPLSRVIHRKTNGNPFYAREVLRQLVRDKAIFYSMKDVQWSWEIHEVESCAGVSDNVVDLVVKKIQHLPPETIDALQLASYLGPRFDASVIDAILLGSTDRCEPLQPQFEKLPKLSHLGSAALKEAVDEDLLVQRGDSNWFRFTHDKIQQAAFSMLVAGEDSQLRHLQIGRHLKKRCDDGDLSSLLSAAVQLNKGSTLINDVTETIELVRLNYRAAKLSKDMSALTSTISFLQSGLALIPQDLLWSEYYDLTLPIQNLRCDVFCSLGQYHESNKIIDEILANARSKEDQFEPSLTRIRLLLFQARLPESIDAGVHLLGYLGEKIPRKPGTPSIIWEFYKSTNALKGRSREAIIQYEEISNTKKLRAKKVLQMICLATFFTQETNLNTILNLRVMQISLKYGMSKYSAFGFAVYGISMGVNGAFQEAYDWGTVTGDLLQRFQSKKSHSDAQVVVHVFLNHLRRPFQESLSPLLVAYNYGMDMGDIQAAGMACSAYLGIYILCGLPLAAIVEDAKGYSATMGEYQQQFSLQAINIWGQLASNLQDQANSLDNPCVLTGIFMNEEETIPLINQANLPTLHLAKLVVAFLLGDLEHAVKIIEKEQKKVNLSALGTGFLVPAKCFFSAMTALVIEQHWAKTKKWKHKYRKLRCSFVARLEKWYANGVMHVHPFIMILRAEVAFTEGKLPHAEIKTAYEKSIVASARSGCAYAHAIALERAGVFFRDAQDDVDSARFYLTQAYERYGDWQSNMKLKQMRSEYPGLLGEENMEKVLAVGDEGTGTHSTASSDSSPQKPVASAHVPRLTGMSLTRPTMGVARINVKGMPQFDSTATEKHFAKADELAERLDIPTLLSCPQAMAGL